ncbi:hypothetical protein AMELA_G00127040, partial [Ameiurus melas]
MMYGICGLCVFFVLFLGKANCVKVEQTPLLQATETSDVTIHCRHDDSTLLVMLWYKQNSRTVMSLIGYTTGTTSDPNYEDGYENLFNLGRKSTTEGSLTISNLRQSDSAVYYCA